MGYPVRIELANYCTRRGAMDFKNYITGGNLFIFILFFFKFYLFLFFFFSNCYRNYKLCLEIKPDCVKSGVGLE